MVGVGVSPLELYEWIQRGVIRMFSNGCPLGLVMELYKATGKQVYHALWMETQRDELFERHHTMMRIYY